MAISTLFNRAYSKEPNRLSTLLISYRRLDFFITGRDRELVVVLGLSVLWAIMGKFAQLIYLNFLCDFG